MKPQLPPITLADMVENLAALTDEELQGLIYQAQRELDTRAQQHKTRETI